jgi:hypothetical protein
MPISVSSEKGNRVCGLSLPRVAALIEPFTTLDADDQVDPARDPASDPARDPSASRPRPGRLVIFDVTSLEETGSSARRVFNSFQKLIYRRM